jgi:hypothetical protein
MAAAAELLRSHMPAEQSDWLDRRKRWAKENCGTALPAWMKKFASPLKIMMI